jgi:hypothetical protein
VAVHKSLNIILWNARGLFSQNLKNREKKLQALQLHIFKADIILLQETHAELYLINKYFGLYKQRFHIILSSCKDTSSDTDSAEDIQHSGGLIFMLDKSKTDAGATIELFEAIPGRAAKVTVSLGNHSTIYWNIHNYGFSAAETTELIQLIQRDRQAAAQDPQHHSLWCIGDFNREPPHTPRISISEPSRAYYPHIGENTNHNHGFKWDALFQDLVEIVSPDPTHLIADSLLLNIIDRAFTSVPSHAWLTVQPAISTLIRPDDAHANGISDHAMLMVSASLRAPPDPETLPIKAEVFKHPEFQRQLQILYDYVPLENLPTWERWETNKTILRQAALRTRDFMLLNDRNSTFSEQMTLSTLTRAIWHNNVPLANLILE